MLSRLADEESDKVQKVGVAVEEVGCLGTSCRGRRRHLHGDFTCMEVLEQGKPCSWTCFMSSCKSFNSVRLLNWTLVNQPSCLELIVCSLSVVYLTDLRHGGRDEFTSTISCLTSIVVYK